MSTILENKIEIKSQNLPQTEIITIQVEIEIETEEITIESTKIKMNTKDLTINTNKNLIPIPEAEINKQVATTEKHQPDNKKITIQDLRDRPIEILIFQDSMVVDIDRYE